MLTKEQWEWVEKSYKELSYKKSTLGMYIRYHRLMNHMTTREIEEKSGVTRAHIHHLELGKREPGAKVIYKICKVFNIDGNTLMKILEEDYETP